jgi:hypothetical protein
MKPSRAPHGSSNNGPTISASKSVLVPQCALREIVRYDPLSKKCDHWGTELKFNGERRERLGEAKIVVYMIAHAPTKQNNTTNITKTRQRANHEELKESEGSKKGRRICERLGV